MGARGLRSSWESIARNSSFRRLVSANVSACHFASLQLAAFGDVPDVALNDLLYDLPR